MISVITKKILTNEENCAIIKIVKFKILLLSITFEVILVLLAGYLFYKNLSRKDEEIFKKNVLYKLEKYKIDIEKALINSDDLLLLSTIQQIAELKNIKYSFLLSPKGKVLAHSKVEEIGKTYNSDFHKKTLLVKNPVFFQLKTKNLYDLSIPLWKGIKKIAILRIGVSYKSLSEKTKETKQIIIFLGGIIVILFFIIEISLIETQITPVIKNINLILEKLNMQQFDEEFKLNKNEKILKNIEKNINKLKQKLKTKPTVSTDNKNITAENNKNNKEIIKTISSIIDKAFVLVNSENLIEFANEKAKELLNLKDCENKHIFDCFEKNIIPLFEEAIKNKELISKNIDDLKYSIKFLENIGFILIIG